MPRPVHIPTPTPDALPEGTEPPDDRGPFAGLDGPSRLTRRTITQRTGTPLGRRRLMPREPVPPRAEQGIQDLDPALAGKIGQLRDGIAAAPRGDLV